MVRKINTTLVLRLRPEGLSFVHLETQGVSRHSVIYDRFCRNYAQHVRTLGVTSRVGRKAGQTIERAWRNF